MLQRLASRPEMKNAWAELRHFSEVEPGIVVATTASTWLSAMRNHLGGSPGSGPSFREVARDARTVADAIRVNQAIKIEHEITDAWLDELDRVATIFDREAQLFDKVLNIVEFSRKKKARNAPQIAFVNHMCDLFPRPTGRRPYKLITILANVAFDVPAGKQWNADRVKHCHGSRSRSK
jgi:hypothetical protein